MADMDREFGWEDEIEKDGSDFVLLPEGDYDFTVKAFQRGRHNGSAKLPACNKAELTITIWGAEDSVDIKHNLFLHSKVEGLLSAFFTAIGQKKHGEKLRMNWSTVIGGKGKCRVYIDEYTGTDGKTYRSNKIRRFYEPDADIQTLSAKRNTAAPTAAQDNKWAGTSWS